MLHQMKNKNPYIKLINFWKNVANIEIFKLRVQTKWKIKFVIIVTNTVLFIYTY